MALMSISFRDVLRGALTMVGNPRALAAFMHDLLAVALAWTLAFWLRFNLDVPPEFVTSARNSLAWVLPLYGVLFFAFRLYEGLWRFASLADLQHIVAAVGTGTTLVTAAVILSDWESVPRSVLVLHPLLLGMAMGGSRFAYRSWKEHGLYGPSRLRGQPVLVIGAGEAADSLLRELHRSSLWYAVALVSENAAEKGRRLHGLPVFAPLSRIPEIAEKYAVRHAILAMPAASAQERRQAAELAAAAGMAVLTMPSYDDLLAGRLSVSNIRRVQLEDLLGREAVSFDDRSLHELLSSSVVMVSGAGGSIGAELCRQIAKYRPSRLVLFELSEFALYQVCEELKQASLPFDIACWAGDIRDEERVAEVLAAERPGVIFHAAAYKHVPLMEDINAWQAVRNNVLGTLRLARAAQRHGVGRFVLVSTDKAVNPTNVMGASKRLAERVCRALQKENGTRFVTVRFGNVLGSNGSVIPKFREQIARGGPVTVTHPDIVRYFMTIPEAAQLVLLAGSMGQGGEIFVLDMGEPVKIFDLARDMIRLSGLSEDEIRIEVTGLRPGEKLYEELLSDSEATLPTPHPKLRIARLADDGGNGLEDIARWLQAGVRDTESVKAGLRHFVPEYRPQDGEAALTCPHSLAASTSS